MTAIPCERRLATERRNHAEAFSTLASSFDRLAEEIVLERERRLAAEVVVFRCKSRFWFRARAAA